MSDTPDATPGAPAEPARDAEFERLERRRRRMLTGAFVAVLLVIVAALGLATLRDPGPQPPIPPDISGTDDGALKRAVVHYFGALADESTDELVDLMGTDDARSQALARIVVDEFGTVARAKADVKITESADFGGVRHADITFADGRTQSVNFFKEGGTWTPLPVTDEELPAVPDSGATPSATVAP